MATSLTEILSAMQNGVTGINNLAARLSSIFPQTTATSTAAPTGGTITFSSSRPKLFLTVTTSSGGVYQIPGY